MTRFTEYERWMWNTLTWFTVCRFYIEREEKTGKYRIRKANKFQLFCYYFLWVNSTVKVIYLILTYQGWLQPIHFLDQMSMWDWFLCTSQLIQEINIWHRRGPLYELFYRTWILQEEIYKKLGSPEHIDLKIHKNDSILVWMHTVIVMVGCGFLMVQVYADPKYVVFTYSIFPYTNLFFDLVFAAHEYLFMFHIWVFQATTVVLPQVNAVSYTLLIAEMTKVMYRLIELGEEKEEVKDANGVFIEHFPGRSVRKVNGVNRKCIPAKLVKPETIVPGTLYDIQGLIRDYKKIMIYTNAYNAWVGKLVGGTDASSYAQFVSDVFMMIQLLKEPGTTFMDVVFFFEDAAAGMIELFRMFILMSRLAPTSDEFLQAFKCYLQYDSPIKKFLLKTQPTLRPVAAKIGGHSTRPGTVPKAVNGLMSYYIAAAMWQRPQDRIT